MHSKQGERKNNNTIKQTLRYYNNWHVEWFTCGKPHSWANLHSCSCKSTQIKVSRGLSLTLTATVREQKKSRNDCKVELPHLKIYNIYLLSPSAGQHTQTTLLEKSFIYSQLSPSRGRQSKTKTTNAYYKYYYNYFYLRIKIINTNTNHKISENTGLLGGISIPTCSHAARFISFEFSKFLLKCKLCWPVMSEQALVSCRWRVHVDQKQEKDLPKCNPLKLLVIWQWLGFLKMQQSATVNNLSQRLVITLKAKSPD